MQWHRMTFWVRGKVGGGRRGCWYSGVEFTHMNRNIQFPGRQSGNIWKGGSEGIPPRAWRKFWKKDLFPGNFLQHYGKNWCRQTWSRSRHKVLLGGIGSIWFWKEREGVLGDANKASKRIKIWHVFQASSSNLRANIESYRHHGITGRPETEVLWSIIGRCWLFMSNWYAHLLCAFLVVFATSWVF